MQAQLAEIRRKYAALTPEEIKCIDKATPRLIQFYTIIIQKTATFQRFLLFSVTLYCDQSNRQECMTEIAPIHR